MNSTVLTNDFQQVRDRDDDRVGVIIPVYNRAKTLLETLPFVAAQTKQPERLVIVDDGSTDDTANVVEAWLTKEDPGFEWQVLREPHRNAATARNVGMTELGSLPFVAFLDSDDHWPNDFLERTASALATNPLAIAASADRYFIDIRSRKKWRDRTQALAKDPISWMFNNGAGIASCSLFRQDAIVAAGCWDEELGTAEDFALFVEVAQLGHWLHSTGKSVRFHHGTANLRQEEGNLSKRHRLRDGWASRYEQVYADLCERNICINSSAIERSIARMWEDAANELFIARQYSEARECLAKARSWRSSLRLTLRLAVDSVRQWCAA